MIIFHFLLKILTHLFNLKIIKIIEKYDEIYHFLLKIIDNVFVYKID